MLPRHMKIKIENTIDPAENNVLSNILTGRHHLSFMKGFGCLF